MRLPVSFSFRLANLWVGYGKGEVAGGEEVVGLRVPLCFHVEQHCCFSHTQHVKLRKAETTRCPLLALNNRSTPLLVPFKNIIYLPKIHSCFECLYFLLFIFLFCYCWAHKIVFS